MWAKDRHHRIVSLLAVNEHLSIDRLVEELKVSKESIRRDIVQLEADGKLLRVHGGVARALTAAEPPFQSRLHSQTEAKRRIGIEAARLVSPGMMCAIDAGSTTKAFAAALAGIPKVAIVTNGIDVALTIRAVQPDADIVLLGGQVGQDVPGTYGEMTVATIRRFSCDMAFFSPVALNPQRGASDYHLVESEVARAMIEASSRVVLLADASKLDTSSRVQVCTCQEIDVLITDKRISTVQVEAYRAAGIKDITVC